MTIDVRVLGLDAALDELRASLDRELPDGMLGAAEVVAEEARREHPYTTRTGDLESRTAVGQVTGRASDGEIVAEVLGDTDYGEYVEKRPGFAFLEPAGERTEAEQVAAVEAALERAAQAW